MNASRQGSWDRFLFINNWKNVLLCKGLCYIWSVNAWVNRQCLNWFVLQGTRNKPSLILIKSLENYFTVFSNLICLEFCNKEPVIIYCNAHNCQLCLNFENICVIPVHFHFASLCLSCSEFSSLAEKYKRKLTLPHSAMRSPMNSIARVNRRKSLRKYTCQS